MRNARIERLSREQYAEMLRAGKRLVNWSLYEPDQRPGRVYYIVDLGGGLTANKREEC